MSVRDELRARQRGEDVPPAALVRRPLDTVRFEPVRFLVPGLVPLQAVTLLVGDPGLGKSTWTCLVAAGATRGLFGDPTVVAVVNAEDSLKAVIGPRMQAAGADLSLVEALSADHGDYERLITLPDDVQALEGFIVETGARLLILDPLMAFLTDKADANQDHSVRRAIGSLAQMAERHDVAVCVCAHLNKDEQKSLLYRVGGSIGLVGAARSILLFARDPDDPDGERGRRRLVAHAKSNWAQLAPTLAYEIEPETIIVGDEIIETSRLAARGESDLTAEQLVGKRKEPGKTQEAADEILEVLADGQPRLSQEVKREVREAVGCGLRTVERAAEMLRADGKIGAGGDTTATVWQLPPSTPATSLAQDGGGSANPAVEPNPTPAAMAGEGHGGSRNGKVADELIAPDWRDQFRRDHKDGTS
jgi:hypothetical protein